VTWGALERVGRGRYRVGLRLWQLGSLAPSARTLRDVALAFLHDLLEVTFFGPVAPVVAFSTLDEAVALANGTEYGLSLGILTRDVMKGLALAERIPSGLVHINDQTVNDEALIPFGGVGESGTGSRHGGTQANLDAFTEVQWVTVRGDLPQYPF
jgi:benzaldehyde dehydrogenase (NAD)